VRSGLNDRAIRPREPYAAPSAPIGPTPFSEQRTREGVRAELVGRSWLVRRFHVFTPDGGYAVDYDGLRIAEAVYVDGKRVASGLSLWFVPLFDFRIGSYAAEVELRVWPWFAMRWFSLRVGGRVVYEGGSRR
jgi:hypothetical protein